MSDAEAAPAPAAPAPAKKTPKKKTAAKPKKPASHPKYSEMIRKAITEMKSRGGSSRQAILKYIITNYTVNEDAAKNPLRLSLRAGVKNGTLKQCKGSGASGSFRLGEKTEKKTKTKKAKKAKTAGAKPKVKKVKKPKAAVTKKSPKKTKKPKAKKPAGEKKAKAAKPKAAKPKAKKAKTPKKTKAAKK